ncbi:MAG: hypothetical protein ACM3KR_09215 [Deltaproteobacteria bacterium]
MKKERDVETFIDNSPVFGVNTLPERFGLKTIIQKQERNALEKQLQNNWESPQFSGGSRLIDIALFF